MPSKKPNDRFVKHDLKRNILDDDADMVQPGKVRDMVNLFERLNVRQHESSSNPIRSRKATKKKAASKQEKQEKLSKKLILVAKATNEEKQPSEKRTSFLTSIQQLFKVAKPFKSEERTTKSTNTSTQVQTVWPLSPIFTPPSALNTNLTSTPVTLKKPLMSYDISDLKSGDETDDDEEPKRPVPEWALPENATKSVFNQGRRFVNYTKLFRKVNTIDIKLDDIFVIKRDHFNERTSSGHWPKPPAWTVNSLDSTIDQSFKRFL